MGSLQTFFFQKLRFQFKTISKFANRVVLVLIQDKKGRGGVYIKTIQANKNRFYSK
jgi:hypothetical protein